MAWAEVIISMVLLVTLLMGIVPMFIAIMRINTRDRWETFAVAQTRELIEIIKRIASTPTGYISGDTNGNTIIDNPAGYQELNLVDGNHSDPNNPISFVSGAKTVMVDRHYRVVTTTTRTSSYKTITGWIEPTGFSNTKTILKKVALETVISSP